MEMIGSVVEEQGVTFAIVLVKRWAEQTDSEAGKTRQVFQAYFPGLPLILASQAADGTFEYQGRPDIVRFLAATDLSRIPWKKYRTNG